MAMIKYRQQSSLLPILGMFISIIGGGCATTEKTEDKAKNDLVKAESSQTDQGEVPTGGDATQMAVNSTMSDDSSSVTTESQDPELSAMTPPEEGQIEESPPQSSEGAEDQKPKSDKFDGYYLLEKGATVANKHPLPDLIPFTQKVFQNEKLIAQYLRFRGWDFNKDGVIDMLEELDQSGNVLKRDYDFNSDGKSDHVD